MRRTGSFGLTVILMVLSTCLLVISSVQLVAASKAPVDGANIGAGVAAFQVCCAIAPAGIAVLIARRPLRFGVRLGLVAAAAFLLAWGGLLASTYERGEV